MALGRGGEWEEGWVGRRRWGGGGGGEGGEIRMNEMKKRREIN